MRPEPLSGVGRLLRLLRARGMFVFGVLSAFGTILCPRYVSQACAVLMLGIRPDCLRSEPRL